MRWRTLSLLVAAMVVLIGCGDDEDQEAPTTTLDGSAATTTGVPPAAQATTVPGPLTGAGTTPVSVPARGDRALLTEVRTGHQEGFDRVVFEFEGPDVPGYQVGYQDRPVRQDGSGNEVSVAGDTVLVVRLENASGADITGAGLRETYTGPSRITTPNPRTVVELVRIGDFEGVLTWAVGTTAPKPFKVTSQAAPTRVVVDLEAR